MLNKLYVKIYEKKCIAYIVMIYICNFVGGKQQDPFVDLIAKSFYIHQVIL